ncbi:MAG: DUF1573 domain-containing protein [Patescibacteria group bacterium]
MKTTNIIILACVIVIGLFVWGYFSKGGTTASVQGVSETNSTASKSLLIASEKFYDFGTISMKNGNVIKEFTVTNSGDKDVTVGTVLTSCMCTTALIVGPDGSTKGPFGMAGHGGSVPPANEIIKVGESRIIRVVFNPNAHGPAGVGPIDRFITITDTSGDTLQFEVKAVVTP